MEVGTADIAGFTSGQYVGGPAMNQIHFKGLTIYAALLRGDAVEIADKVLYMQRYHATLYAKIRRYACNGEGCSKVRPHYQSTGK